MLLLLSVDENIPQMNWPCALAEIQSPLVLDQEGVHYMGYQSSSFCIAAIILP